jgi:hypothetical protein
MNNANFVSIGMDVSDSSAHVCVMDRTGVIDEFVVFLDERTLLEKLPFVDAKSGVIVMETGNRAAWLKRLLTAAGWRVIVADARKLKMIAGQAVKTDTRDARILARLGLADANMPATDQLLSDTWVRTVEHQATYDQLMMRDHLVHRRADFVREVRALVKMRGGKLPSCSTRSFSTLLSTMSPALQAITLPVFTVIIAMSKAIDDIEADIERQAKTIPAVQLMLSVVGVGPLTVMAFHSVVGDPTRFQSARDIGPYLGLTPQVDQSGQLNPTLGISKCGNPFLRRLLVQCANYILGPRNKTDSALRQWGLAKIEKCGARSSKKVRIAVARKLAVMLLAIWKQDSTWQAFPGTASEAGIPSAPVDRDDCVRPSVLQHDTCEIAASPTDQIQPCAHREVTTDESAECRRDSAPVAAEKKPRKVAKAATRKVPRQADPKHAPKMPRPAPSSSSMPTAPRLAATGTRPREAARAAGPLRNVGEDDVLHAEHRC